ncbi:hypothetical protein GCM10007989_20940 [Devosia pacifica]|uniref:Uncharacterized protein n=1 Tax=Devosia pacifica TaxID=1335967 RepID=A0A918VUR7_9HYPH|nr:hypothetical protein [Devosia pacifica]GHA25077.1 hypothetical protein GCM10007989_20940 [Devosia pacifica]
MNPFLRRATEYLRDTSAFLHITSPEPLKTFIARHPKVNDILDLPVRIIGSPGTGKTMMASIVEYRLVEAILRDQSSDETRALAAALTDIHFADGVDPKVVSVRLPMESEYRDFWELPYEDGVKTKLMLSLIQARAMLGWLRTLTANKYRELEDITVIARQGADAQVDQIGGLSSVAIRDRAREVERAVYSVGASLLPPDLADIPSTAQSPYQPFEAIQSFEVTWKSSRISLRPLVILDDVHNLHPEQYAALMHALARREIRVGRWMMMRMDALSPNAVFRSPDESALPGLKYDRDYFDIVMESAANRTGERRQFRKMATDMANRYLRYVEPLQERGYQAFSPLLSKEPPLLTQNNRQKLASVIDREQKALEITSSRREHIRKVVKRYAKGSTKADLTPDVEEAMLRILMHRHAGRVAGTTMSLFDDPEPNVPVKAKSQIVDAARVHLHHDYGRPLHFGMEDLCNASGENAELFLQLAGSLVARMETKVIRNQETTLTPAQQQDALTERASEIIAKWSFPYSKRVRALIDRFVADCRENAMQPNAPLGGGANTIGILESEMKQLLHSDTELPVVLKYAIAYGALSAVRDYGQGGKQWCLLELSGPVCLANGLDLSRGNFLERTVEDLNQILGEAD